VVVCASKPGFDESPSDGSRYGVVSSGTGLSSVAVVSGEVVVVGTADVDGAEESSEPPPPEPQAASTTSRNAPTSGPVRPADRRTRDVCVFMTV
jgi:hypothetical protein